MGECERVAKHLVDLMRNWHYVINDYEEGKIAVSKFRKEREETTAELVDVLSKAVKECG